MHVVPAHLQGKTHQMRPGALRARYLAKQIARGDGTLLGMFCSSSGALLARWAERRGHIAKRVRSIKTNKHGFMKLKEIMTKLVETVAPDIPIQEAANRMRSLDVGVLPVFKGDRLVGMLTDRDLTIRAIAEGKDPKTTTVQEAMTADVAYCFEDQDVEEAGRIMKENQIRRLPVLNRDKLLVGIVSLGDLATRADEKRAGETLEKVSEPS
jgi:CBS domain-containing protein